jgi:hypothetical protein
MRFLLILLSATLSTYSLADRHKPIAGRAYKKNVIAGFPVYFDKTINNGLIYAKSLGLVERLIHGSKNVLPGHLFRELSRKEFKIYIFQKNLVPKTFKTSAEYVRKYQFLWDKRVGRQMSVSMLLVDIEDFIAHDYYASSTFIHELAHFYHLECIPDHNRRIKSAYNLAKTRGLYRGQYNMKNHNEYFACSSVSFFGDKRWNTRYPYTTLDLHKYDPAGYRLCLELWSAKIRPRTR